MVKIKEFTRCPILQIFIRDKRKIIVNLQIILAVIKISICSRDKMVVYVYNSSGTGKIINSFLLGLYIGLELSYP
jgi:hypothetical protein